MSLPEDDVIASRGAAMTKMYRKRDLRTVVFLFCRKQEKLLAHHHLSFAVFLFFVEEGEALRSWPSTIREVAYYTS